ncbi:RNA polymerase sigma factor [Haloimpatiens sp. FM7315]|uniref:RNA polymerase sigma factor n=1 Tax=Haloimpatiens sp. FM7315 TaxID=3298609 RepID=UPI0035A2EB4D
MLFGKSKKRQNNIKDLKRFEDEISLIYKELYRFVYSMIKNKTITEDCIQNTLLIAYKNYENLRAKDKFKSWIFTIARREGIKILNKNYKEFPEKDDMLQLVINKENNLDIAEDTVLMKELTSIVLKGIGKLKPEYKEILNLRYYNDMTFEEIAKILDINVNTVRTRHMRAKDKIYKFLIENYYDCEEIKKENV